jgi:diaminopimelate decarboxylase
MQNLQHATLASWVKDIDIEKLNKEYGSPSWIVSESQLLHNVIAFERFTGSRSRIYFPIKANPSLTVLQLLAQMGAGADCASRSEVDLARFAGISVEAISYNTPVQDVALCKSLLESGANVVMDDPEAILELQSNLDNTQVKGKLLLRLSLPDYGEYSEKNDLQELMAHGHKSSKFGIPVEELGRLIETLTMPIGGLHVHVGTQMDNLNSFTFALNELHNWAEFLLERGHPVCEINLGGGLGIPFAEQDRFPSLELWVNTLTALKKPQFEYSVEPGHALVGNAVALLMKVMAIKNTRGKRWAITDVGTDQLTKITLLRWPHRILTSSGTILPPGNDAVAGPLCFAGDTLLENVSVTSLSKGNPLLLTEAGAYTYALSNRFNGRLFPQWIVIKEDGHTIQTVKKEDRYENLQLANFNWSSLKDENLGQELPSELVLKLSSTYLRETSSSDQFTYLKAINLASKVYQFETTTSSDVDFISMPFAIRIFGDAAIVAVLHDGGHAVKRHAVWGRRVVMDCFNQLQSNKNLEFTISLSDTYQSGAFTALVAHFKTTCGNCSGSFIVMH